MAHGEYIRFVSASIGEEKSNQDISHPDTSNSLTGDEAKNFYEQLVNDSQPTSSLDSEKQDNCNYQSTSATQNETSTDCSADCIDLTSEIKEEYSEVDLWTQSNNNTCTSSIGEVNLQRDSVTTNYSETYCRKHQNLLRFSQNGDIDDLNKLLRSDLDINIDYQDQYGWTALMCAAVARQHEVVKILLSKGANKFILNKKDKNVLELCEEIGAIDVKIVINTFKNCVEEVSGKSKSKTQSFYCETCKTKFTESTVIQHQASTAHLFNLKLKPKEDHFMITENNRGFQLMKRSGWDGEKGLGPKGQGHKYPVKTVLKKDRKCLGTEVKTKAKVTHFGPKDTSAVQSVIKKSERVMSAKTISKRERKRKEQKARLWERNLRTYMNIDL